MRNLLLITERDIKAYLRSPFSYVVAAIVLILEGAWFMSQGMTGQRLSADVLFRYLEAAGGGAMGLALLLSVVLIAREREVGRFVLLNTAPIRERDIVLGKFLAGFCYIVALTAIGLYMPLLIFVNGKVSLGHIAVGVLGVLLLGAATLAVGMFASTLASTQFFAGAMAVGIWLVWILLWLVARVTDPPVSTFLSALALHHERQRAFMIGVLKLENVVFYVGATYVFLLCATKALEARRWR